MKVIQVVPSIGAEASGPSYSVPGLCRGLQVNDVTTVLHFLDDVPNHLLNASYQIENYPRQDKFNLGWSSKMLQGLKEACQSADIIHNNSLWMMPNVYPLWVCKGTKCKLVVAPRGTLADWSLKKGWLKKKIFGWLLQNAVLRHADMFHATSEKEYEEIRAQGYKQPVAIVPIGMDMPVLGNKTTEDTENTEKELTTNCTNVQEFLKPQNTQKGSCGQDCQEDGKPQKTEGYAPEHNVLGNTQKEDVGDLKLATGNWKQATEHDRLRRIVFFGRVHKVKAVDHLVKAWGQLHANLPEWELVIAGPDCGAKGELEAIIADEQIPRVRFMGEICGPAKYDFLTEADIYVLPSHTENFGVTVAEALACGTPTIASQGTPWKGLETEKCGKWVPIGVEPLVYALRELTRLTDDERETMGQRGRAWIQRDFSWDGVGAKMKAAYVWLLGQGEKPNFVRMD